MKKCILIIFSILLLTFISSTVALEQNSNSAVDETNYVCDFCQITIEITEFLIKNYSMTRDQIEDKLSSICTYIPVEYKKECKFFMLFTGPIISKSLYKGEDPLKFCTTYGLCSATQKSPVKNLIVKSFVDDFNQQQSQQIISK
ncbi:hypothetical protein DICPUDRAFT_84267 [Dictyostelium purpureum]|uniref:Saposin B-type domain-containing protein n=1 Tax=Dictyostelium purpureum TaxID=5786 RepID=F1A240_DICPU|nr:uncharacterized protein DICPUDRAFT_84267 [Dictyostelium purpureum]EGC29743.1 hypothetical protein DICPUDRAFT_84267 [Dictyostelium purpureum]|eukprot:XP_003293736.1 hypothetical protein DICPUDRAFT_84267 [Dictyostelium purpureum]